MAKLSEHGIRLSCMSPSYLHSNSTSHTWPFSAIAELIDNACDPGVTAKQIWIDAVVIKDTECLTFTDNGQGMTPNKLHKMLSFGFTDKGQKKNQQPIGVYGNGFKSGSMRLGKDALIFTKNGGCLSVGMLSQTYLEKIRAQAVIVPIVPFSQLNKKLIVTEDSVASLEAILTHSLFQAKEDLLEQFNTIPGKKGTKILIWNIRRNKDGKPELDFETDKFDIRMPDINCDDQGSTGKKAHRGQEWQNKSIPEMNYSLREYCSVLYLKPRTQIILRQKKVNTKLIAKSLANIEYDVYKPSFLSKKVRITFGFNCKNKDHCGIMMYHKNRLIKAYEKVGCQIKSGSRRTGHGVIGVIECDFLKPAHNKQDFQYTKEYRLTLAALGMKLNDYWKEKKETKANEKCEANKEEKPDQIWVQCEDCLKWRKLPRFVEDQGLPEPWYCHLNPNPKFRNCIVPEEQEESEDELTPSYDKTFKKQESSLDQKRRKSVQATAYKQDDSEELLETAKHSTVMSEMESSTKMESPKSLTLNSKKRKTVSNNAGNSKRPKSTICADQYTRKGQAQDSYGEEGDDDMSEEHDEDVDDDVIFTQEKKAKSTLRKIKNEFSQDSENAKDTDTVYDQKLNGDSPLHNSEIRVSESICSTTQTNILHVVKKNDSEIKGEMEENNNLVDNMDEDDFNLTASVPLQSAENVAMSERITELENEANGLRRMLGGPVILNMSKDQSFSKEKLPSSMEELEISYHEVSQERDLLSQSLKEAATTLKSISAERDKYQLKVTQLELERAQLQEECNKSQQELILLQSQSTVNSEQVCLYSKKNKNIHYSTFEPLNSELDRLRVEKQNLENQVKQLDHRLKRSKETLDKATSTQSVSTEGMPLVQVRRLRENVALLLSSVLPHLDLQDINYDTGDIDHILEQVIEANKI
uniref:MORC family CW-type zinc finger 4 n=1 Tax=Erpetoichthys calabaricus TaxID=27687 RepID=A0A8C4SJA1_ERPCA